MFEDGVAPSNSVRDRGLQVAGPFVLGGQNGPTSMVLQWFSAVGAPRWLRSAGATRFMDGTKPLGQTDLIAFKPLSLFVTKVPGYSSPKSPAKPGCPPFETSIQILTSPCTIVMGAPSSVMRL